MSIVISSTWNGPDDQELYDYLENILKRPHIILDATELLKINPRDCDCIFAPSEIINQLLSTHFISYSQIPTYPYYFESLYCREIRKIKFGELKNYPRPIFIKPVSNDKSFAGFILTTDNIYDHPEYNGNMMSDDKEIYISNVVHFSNEYRLFIGINKLIGIVDASRFVLGISGDQSLPPENFIASVLQLNPYPWVVIDVGLISTGKWVVVEVNPPYALSSYDWDINAYFNYCKNAWMYTILSLSMKQNKMISELGNR